MKKMFFLLAVLSTMNGIAQNTKTLQKIAESSITAADLKTKLTVIASAAMEGRETATPGQKRAAAFIENYFKQLGLLPGTGNGYQMNFPVYRDSLISASLNVNSHAFAEDKDFGVNLSSLSAGNWNEDTVVFAAFGMVDSADNDYRNLNVKNKWVMVVEGSGEDINKPSGSVSYGFRDPASAFMKIFQARNLGAKGLIIVSKDYPKKMPSPALGNMYLKKSVTNNLPAVTISYTAAATILNKSLSAFIDLKNINSGDYPAKFAFGCSTQTVTLQSSNVIGVLPGTDKKDEYVFVTGHYDHLGKRDSVIYYGADDDGSGTTSVLEIAKAFTEAKADGYAPRRTIVFMTVSGEEKGLWGSDYYTSHPIFSLEKTSVDLNIDMVGRIDPGRKETDSTNYVYTIGEDKLSTDLIKISDSVNNKFSHLDLDRKFNDPKDPNRFYYRSDHFNFAKHGVPVIFYFNGTHADYHRPTDTVDKINFALMEKRARFIFYTAWAIANRDNQLVRDIPLK